MKVARNEEGYRFLSMRFGRYEKERADALGGIGYEKVLGGIPDRFIGWQEVHKRVLGKREQAGYSSGTAEKQYTERKGASGKKDTARKGPKGNRTHLRERGT